MNRVTFAALVYSLALVAGLSGTAAVRAQPLNPALGECIFPNPGTGGNPNFDQEFDAFSAALGAVPHFACAYTDNSNGLSNVAGSAYWYTNPTQSDPRFTNGKITPVIGLPMAAPEDSGNAPAIVNRFNDIAAGKY